MSCWFVLLAIRTCPSLTLGLVTEGLAAHLALEGLVARVDVLVLQHVGLTQEALATEGTRKVLEMFPRRALLVNLPGNNSQTGQF